MIVRDTDIHVTMDDVYAAQKYIEEKHRTCPALVEIEQMHCNHHNLIAWKTGVLTPPLKNHLLAPRWKFHYAYAVARVHKLIKKINELEAAEA